MYLKSLASIAGKGFFYLIALNIIKGEKMFILPLITVSLIAFFLYLKNKNKDQVQSQFVVFSTLTFITILIIISSCCTILNFIFKWIF